MIMINDNNDIIRVIMKMSGYEGNEEPFFVSCQTPSSQSFVSMSRCSGDTNHNESIIRAKLSSRFFNSVDVNILFSNHN